MRKSTLFILRFIITQIIYKIGEKNFIKMIENLDQ